MKPNLSPPPLLARLSSTLVSPGPKVGRAVKAL